MKKTKPEGGVGGCDRARKHYPHDGQVPPQSCRRGHAFPLRLRPYVANYPRPHHPHPPPQEVQKAESAMTETAKRPWVVARDIDHTGTYAVYNANGSKLLAEFYGPHAEAHARLFAAGPERDEEIKKFREALCGLIGLVQIIISRGDVSKDAAEEIRYNHRMIEALRWSGIAHTHVAGTTRGRDIDECAVCGRDIRDPIHSKTALAKLTAKK